MAVIERLDSLYSKLREQVKQKTADMDKSVVVGFTAAYALWVHENVEMKGAGKPRPSGIGVYWGPAGQAKFLEQPARELAPLLGKMVADGIKAGLSWVSAALRAGLRLQRESQLLVPVEYGNLKASAFTRVE